MDNLNKYLVTKLYKDIVKFEEDLNKITTHNGKRDTRFRQRINQIRNDYADLNEKDFIYEKMEKLI